MPKKKVRRSCFGVAPIRTVAALEDTLSEPTPGVVEAMGRMKGDLVILGVSGKIGPTLARMAGRAVMASGKSRRILGVSDVFTAAQRRQLNKAGVETVQADLLTPGALEALPDAANVIYMCGQKFGSTGAEWNTWGINVFLAGVVARRYRKSRIVVFSSGNIYPFEPLTSGGSTEDTPPAPVGEYAMSCLGRERMFDFHSHKLGTKVLQFRLNYAAELRYGIVFDIATKVWEGTPVDVTMGHVNCVWQGYASGIALQALALADTPPRILNVTGPETVSIRWLAHRMGKLMGKTPAIEGEEAPSALLNNAAQCHKLFGYPAVSIDTLAEWVAQWVMAGGKNLGKPTHYEVRDGKF